MCTGTEEKRGETKTDANVWISREAGRKREVENIEQLTGDDGEMWKTEKETEKAQEFDGKEPRRGERKGSWEGRERVRLVQLFIKRLCC